MCVNYYSGNKATFLNVKKKNIVFALNVYSLLVLKIFFLKDVYVENIVKEDSCGLYKDCSELWIVTITYLE